MINEKLSKTIQQNAQSLKYSSCCYLEKANTREKKNNVKQGPGWADMYKFWK